MSDRMYGRCSSNILLNLSEDSTQNAIELECLQEYIFLLKEYYHSSSLLRICENSNSLKHRLQAETIKYESLKKRLIMLESSQPIQDILKREQKDDEIIEMMFANETTIETVSFAQSILNRLKKLFAPKE